MVERTDDDPGTGSATYCSAVSLRQASRTLRLAQRSYANRATKSSCMVISLGLGKGPMSGASGAVACVSGRAGTPPTHSLRRAAVHGNGAVAEGTAARRRDAAALDCASNKRPGERVGQGLVAERLGSVRGHVWAGPGPRACYNLRHRPLITS